jgi:predicted permease
VAPGCTLVQSHGETGGAAAPYGMMQPWAFGPTHGSGSKNMHTLLQDIRYALRALRRTPGFTVVAVTTLALGIGVNATVFSIVSTVLFTTLPVERPGELVNVYGHEVTSVAHDAISYPNFLEYRARSGTLAGVAAHTNFFASLSMEGSSELVVGEIVSEDFFGLLGVRPVLGRTFTSDEFAGPGAGPVAILSHTFWQARFGGAPDVVGRSFRLNGIVYTVVGVAPRRFGGMFPGLTAQLWIPLSMVDHVEAVGSRRNTGGRGESLLDSRGLHFLWVKGRMRPGVELAQVRAELETIAGGLATEYPAANERERVKVVRTNDVALNPDLDGTVTPVGLVLLGAVALVLLVACGNLASLLLARAAARRQELAVRQALGATRRRLVRLLLTESMLVAFAGGAASLLLTLWLTGFLVRFRPGLPADLGLAVSPDWRVVAFTFAAALATGMAFGLAPALRASRPDLVPALKDSGGDGRTRRGPRVELREALVVGQVAFSLLLLVAGALLARSLDAARQVDLGYDPYHIAHLSLPLEMNGYDAARGTVLVEAGKRRLEALPEVRAVGLASRLPQSMNNNGFGIFIDGHPTTLADRPIILDGASVDEDYFAALDLRIVAGRALEPGDREHGRRVAVVTRTMAARYWPGQDALGQTFRISREGALYEIVGITEDYKVDTPGESPKPYLHIPLPRQLTFANYLVRTTTPAAGLVPMLERELRQLDGDLVFFETGTLADLAALRLLPIRLGAWLIGLFGLLAVLLSALGLYGVIAFSVSRRVREIGIRKALGAETTGVVALVLRRGMLLVAAGGALGALLAAAGARLLSSFLFVDAFDPLSFAIAFLVLAGFAGFAHWMPARRAARVDPMVALRGE